MAKLLFYLAIVFIACVLFLQRLYNPDIGIENNSYQPVAVHDGVLHLSKRSKGSRAYCQVLTPKEGIKAGSILDVRKLQIAEIDCFARPEVPLEELDLRLDWKVKNDLVRNFPLQETDLVLIKSKPR